MFLIAEEVFACIENAAEAVLRLVPINLFDNYLDATYTEKSERKTASRVLRENNLHLYLQTFNSWVLEQKEDVIAALESISEGDTKTILGSDVVRLRKISYQGGGNLWIS